jgi:hypothetical protein
MNYLSWLQRVYKGDPSYLYTSCPYGWYPIHLVYPRYKGGLGYLVHLYMYCYPRC